MLLWFALLSACRPGDSGTGLIGEPTGETGHAADLRVSSTPVEACADPSRRDESVFDVAFSRAEPAKKAWFWGGGVVVADFDGDTFYDVILPGFWETFYYRGAPDGGLIDETESLTGLPVLGGSGGAAADYDGDGDLDVILTRYMAPNTLLRNDGDRFVDVTELAGLSGEARRSMASSWGDVDRDGDLDLFVGNYGFIDESRVDPDHASFEPAEPSFLYINNGDGTFTDRSADLSQAAHDGYTFSGGFIDVDVDGWLDLYIVNDFGNSYPNVLLRNREGRLVEEDQAGLDVAITGMGLGVGDVNGDGLPDFAMTKWDGNSFLWSSPDFGWVDHADAAGLVNDLTRTQKVGWGVDLVDLDNDGDLDAPMTYGYLDSTYQASTHQPDALYLQEPKGHWVDVGTIWGFNHPTVGRGFVNADFNGDGWLDIVKRDLDGPSLFYVARCGAASWLRVRLFDETSANRFAVGARVEAIIAGETQWRVVMAGTTNHSSSGPPEVHFGLGKAEALDRLRVIWPDGRVDELQDVAARQVLDLTRTVAP